MHVMHGVSAMQNVLNLLLFYYVYSFSVFETVSPKELKKLFQEQFEDFGTRYPGLISPPHFSFSPKKFSGMFECRIVAEFGEPSRTTGEQKLREEIQQVLDDNGISVSWNLIPSGLK